MKRIRIAIMALAAVAVSACSGPQTASGNATNDVAPKATQMSQPARATAQHGVFVPDINIARITVDVPRSLKVSEKNSYYPRGDIVWRGDLFGDRLEQVAAIFDLSARNAAAKLQGSRPVHVHFQVTRFHGVSEKARYNTGGVHNMNFLVTLLDPETGATLRPARQVISNLDALRGNEAIQADGRGDTQKHRVTSFLSQVIQTELTQPHGYVDGNSGLFVALNLK